jgi:hypothetical protein
VAQASFGVQKEGSGRTFHSPSSELTFLERRKREVRRISLPRTSVNIGYVGEVSRAQNYVQRVTAGTTMALSSRYKSPSKITEFFVEGEAAKKR